MIKLDKDKWEDRKQVKRIRETRTPDNYFAIASRHEFELGERTGEDISTFAERKAAIERCQALMSDDECTNLKYPTASRVFGMGQNGEGEIVTGYVIDFYVEDDDVFANYRAFFISSLTDEFWEIDREFWLREWMLRGIDVN